MSESTHVNSFDSLIQNDRLQMIRTALPYMHLSGQRFLSIYLKLLELKNTVSLFQSDESTLSACALQKENGNLLELLHDIRKYCPPDRQEAIDQILNFANMYQMYQTYQAMSQEFTPASSEDADESALPQPSDNSAPNLNFATMEQLKSMLPPKQRTIFETYLSNL